MRKKLLIAAGVLVVLGLIGLGVGYWIVLAPNTGDYDEPRSVFIPRGTGFAASVDSLASSGVLDDRQTFTWMAQATGWGSQIKAGHYRIEAGASNYDLLQKLRRGLQDPVRVTIPPGSRPEVVAAVAAKYMAFDKQDFLAALRDTALAADLNTDTTHLFGYMMPETYQFYWLNDAETVVSKIKQQFDRFYERELKAGADSLGLSKEELINVAAIVQWETDLARETSTVAGVYLNRLRIGMKLDADPTVQYALLQTEGSKRRLLYEDYEIQHPYNTYLRGGLPPGPVTNPAPSTLRAVANAEDHDYLYMVADLENGGHAFNETLRAHNRDAQRMRQELRRRRNERANGSE